MISTTPRWDRITWIPNVNDLDVQNWVEARADVDRPGKVWTWETIPFAESDWRLMGTFIDGDENEGEYHVNSYVPALAYGPRYGTSLGWCEGITRGLESDFVQRFIEE